MVGADGDVVRDLGNDVELFDGDLIDLVHHVQAGHVLPVALDDVDDVVDGRVAVDPHLSVHDSVLLQHLPDDFLVAVYERVAGSDAERQSALFLLGEGDRGWMLVQPHADALQLVLDLLLMGDRLHDVQDDEDQAAAHGRADDLLTATLAILGALDNPGKIQELDLCALVVEDARHACQRRELVRRDLALLPGHLVEQRRLANGGEADEPDSGVARLGHFEAASSAAAATALGALRHDGGPQLGELRLQKTQVGVGGLVLLCPGHLRLDIGDLL
mmetsp:Transcript_6266/g.17970  ORF Transcript_6266/g.17970 Transcript_6266/m.17970 type:complete len:274 (-) Transcript_6266:154-975(-)